MLISEFWTRPTEQHGLWGRPSRTKIRRIPEDIQYWAESWDKPRRISAEIEFYPGELFPRVYSIVINLPMEPDWVVRFCKPNGTAELRIKKGNLTFLLERLLCRQSRENKVRLHLYAPASNLAALLRST